MNSRQDTQTSTSSSATRTSQEVSTQSPTAKPSTSASSARTNSDAESPVPYETYLMMSKEERAAIPYGRRPYRLTPDEIEDLRQNKKELVEKYRNRWAHLRPKA